MKCVHCNGEHPDGFKFCPVTGKEIVQPFKACTNPECVDFNKHILPPDALFCPRCGQKIDKIGAEYEGESYNYDNRHTKSDNNDKVVSRTSYALGMSIAQNIRNSGITSVNIDDFIVGAKAIFAGARPAISFQDATEILDKYFAKLKA